MTNFQVILIVLLKMVCNRIFFSETAARFYSFMNNGNKRKMLVLESCLFLMRLDL